MKGIQTRLTRAVAGAVSNANRVGLARMAISFKVTGAEQALIERIADRAALLAARARVPFDHTARVMDLTATHCNGCPLDLKRMAEADDFNLAHDVYGIANHLDRDTGRLSPKFLPRFARGQGGRCRGRA